LARSSSSLAAAMAGAKAFTAATCAAYFCRVFSPGSPLKSASKPPKMAATRTGARPDDARQRRAGAPTLR
jgi:hypothetical protein